MAKKESWYNGYPWSERWAKFKALMLKIERGELARASGPCRICNDPDAPDPKAPFEYHDEDYSQPYDWGPNAMFSLCRQSHRYKLHKRFNNPLGWKAFLAHVRRGGYARDLKDPKINRQVAAYREALQRGERPKELPTLRPYRGAAGKEWFAKLRMDTETLRDPKAKPRP